MPPSLEERRPAITPQLAIRVALLGGFAFVLFGVVFFRLWFLQVLTGEEYVSQARENRVRKVRIEAPRGDIVDRNGRTLVKTRVAPVVQVVPSQLPEAVLEIADTYRTARSRSEQARLNAGTQLRSLERELNEDGRRRPNRAERRERRRLGRAARRAAPVAIPPRAGVGDPRPQPVPPPGARHRDAPADDPRARDRGRRRDAVLERDDQDRRRTRGVQLPARAQGALPGDRRREALPAQLPARRARRPAVRHAARDLARRSSRSTATAAWRPARGSAPAASSTSTTRTCAAATASRRSSSTRSATATTSARRRAWSPSRAPSCASRSTSTCRRRPTARSSARSRRRPSTAPRRARTWRWTRATARCWRSAPTRASTPTCSPSRSPSASTTR